jgi:PIN domain nuclease of toxin-antitoxin system
MIALDASALLAFLFREEGHEKVEQVLEEGILSTVNLSEVLGRFARDGHDPNLALQNLERGPFEIVPFGAIDAAGAAALLPATTALGLSLGDRACLALAGSRGIRAMTADRSWGQLRLGITIEVIR